MSKPGLLIFVVALVAGGIGFMIASRLSQPATVQPGIGTIQDPAPVVAEELIGRHRPDFTHLDLTGRPVSARDFDGRPLLLNFWATWCKPCVDEMPMLSEIQSGRSAQGLAVVGIALDDAERARSFATELGVEYTVLVGQTDVVLTGRRYGNNTGLLPFSVLVDAQGLIRWTHLGALERGELEAELDKLQ